MCRRGTQINLPYSLLAALAPTLAGQLQLLGPRSSCQPEPQAGVGPGLRVSHGRGLQESTNQDPGRVLVQQLGTARPRGAPRARAATGGGTGPGPAPGSPRWTRTTGTRAGATQWQCRRAQAAAGSHAGHRRGRGRRAQCQLPLPQVGHWQRAMCSLVAPVQGSSVPNVRRQRSLCNAGPHGPFSSSAMWATGWTHLQASQ
jgi:hypothetical protein